MTNKIYSDAYSIYGFVNGNLPKSKEEEEVKIKKYKKFNNMNVNIKKEFTKKHDTRSAQQAMDRFCTFFVGTLECVEIVLGDKDAFARYTYIDNTIMLNYDIIQCDIYGTEINICNDLFKNKFLFEKLNENMYIFIVKYESKTRTFSVSIHLHGLSDIIKWNANYMISNRLNELKYFRCTDDNRNRLLNELEQNKVEIDIQYISFLDNYQDSVNVFSNDSNISKTLLESSNNAHDEFMIEYTYFKDVYSTILDFISVQLTGSRGGILEEKEFIEANTMLFIGARSRMSEYISNLSIYDNMTNRSIINIIPVVRFNSGIEFKFNFTLSSRLIVPMPNSQLIWRPAIKCIADNFRNDGENHEQNFM